MRWRLRILDLMVLTLAAAGVALAARTSVETLSDVALAIYLAFVCLATVGAKFHRGNKSAKAFWKSATFFGWFYFAFGLQLGFVKGEMLIVHAGIGLAFALVCGYATYRLVPRRLPRPPAVAPTHPVESIPPAA